jgi:hypothetical protein
LNRISTNGAGGTQSAIKYEHAGEALNLTLSFEGAHLHGPAHITRVDDRSGEQIAELKRKSEVAAPELVPLNSQQQLSVTVLPNGVALLELA